MDRLVVKLKQHTPLIHFQWEQEGATLRASEVKPKLDRFILEKLGEAKLKEEGVKEISRDVFYEKGKLIAKNLGRLVGNGDHPALDYKMRISLEKYFTVSAQTDKNIFEKNDVKYSDSNTGQIYLESKVNLKKILEANNIQYDERLENQEYLVVSNLNSSQSEVLDKEKILYLSSTPFFAQEDKTFNKHNIDKPNDYAIIEQKAGEYLFHSDKWDELDKKGVMYPGMIVLEISSFNSVLVNSVKEHIQAFFLCENFGTRQSKGFGSFEIIALKNKDGEFDDWRLTPEDIAIKLSEHFQFVYKKQELNSPIDLAGIFKTIQNDFRLLKSGINYPNRPEKYKKSKLFIFGVNKMEPAVRWEKRIIKKEIHKRSGELGNNIELFYQKEPVSGDVGKPNCWDDPEKYNYSYLRAVLGVAEHYEFLIKKKYGDRQGKDNDKIIVKIEGENIERFKSPLLFKVINNALYLVGNDIPEKIKGESFHFKFKLKSSKEQGRDLCTLSIPKFFSLPDFIHFALDSKAWKNCVKNGNNKFDKV